MKANYALVVILVAVLALSGVGCEVPDKVTGGGKFTNTAIGDNYGDNITFGFNAQAKGDIEDPTAPPEVKGQFQLVNHTTKTKIHGSFDGIFTAGIFSGTCTVNGEGPYPLYMAATDAEKPNPTGATIFISVGDFFDPLYSYEGELEAGTIKWHKPKDK